MINHTNITHLLSTLRERQTVEYAGLPHTLWSIQLRKDEPPMAELWTLPASDTANGIDAMESWESEMKLVPVSELTIQP